MKIKTQLFKICETQLTILRGKFIAVNIYIRKQEKVSNQWPQYSSKETRKSGGEQTKPKVRERNNK